MIFVTGTDTGCGKTTVGRALLAAFRARGVDLGVLKPVETGCEPDELGALVPEDATALAKAAGLDLPVERVCPYRLPLPASPERAAAEAGVAIELDAIAAAFEQTRAGDRFVLVEGAGGLLVPLTAEQMMPDLAALLGLPVLVVARDALGTVNHTLLTVEAARSRGLAVVGVILSQSSEPEPEPLRNAEAIAAHGQVPILGTLPHLPDADDATLGRAAEEHLDLEAILRAGSPR